MEGKCSVLEVIYVYEGEVGCPLHADGSSDMGNENWKLDLVQRWSSGDLDKNILGRAVRVKT